MDSENDKGIEPNKQQNKEPGAGKGLCEVILLVIRMCVCTCNVLRQDVSKIRAESSP